MNCSCSYLITYNTSAGGLLKHLRTSGGLSSFGRSSYLSQCEICEDIALSKEAQTCLAKLAPKLAADLIVN